MTTEVRFLAAARIDVAQAMRWYEAQDIQLADRFRDAFQAAVERVPTNRSSMRRFAKISGAGGLMDFPTACFTA